jgi:acyl-coenzyme A thioesterase PaaI-like protein
MRWEDDRYCIACGKENPIGLGLSFDPGEKGVGAVFTASKEHQGYRDVVHGGIVTMLLDEAMSHAAIREGLVPVTGEITVRFKCPMLVGRAVKVEGWIGRRRGRVLEAEGEIRAHPEGGLIAWARAVMFLK